MLAHGVSRGYRICWLCSIKTARFHVKSLASELIHKKIFVSSVLPGAFISQGNAFERLKKIKKFI